MGDRILNGSLQVHEDLTTLLDAFHGGSEIVIKENHISGFLGDVRTRNVHGNAQVCTLQSRGVIDTITSSMALY